MGTSKDQRLRIVKSRWRFLRLFSLRLVLVIFICTSDKVAAAAAATTEDRELLHHEYMLLFPPNDEYDAMILNPNTIYGSPTGGFSRATASRLSSMPLKLPPIIASDDDEKEDDRNDDSGNGDSSSSSSSSSLHFQIRDMYGRSFVCHTLYHHHSTEEKEDENNKNNGKKKNHLMILNDSLFAPPINYFDEDDYENYNHKTHKSRRSNVHDGRYDSSSTSRKNRDDGFSIVERIQADPVGVATDMIGRINTLKGICARAVVEEEIQTNRRNDNNNVQIKITYEWCFEKYLKQTVETTSRNQKTTYRTNSLGIFDTRQVLFYISLMEELDGSDDDKNHYMDNDQEEIARVQDEYISGDNCPDGLSAKITYQCCSPDIIHGSQSTIYHSNDPSSTPVTNLELSFHIEGNDNEETSSCIQHNFVVCTPMLCDGYEDKMKESVMGPNEDEEEDDNNADRSKHDYKHMSIREIIEKRFQAKSTTLLSSVLHAIGGEREKKLEAKKPCIYYESSGWWSYEFCPGDAIRQFHIAVVVDPTTGLASYEKQDEYILGRYPELGSSSSSSDDEEDWNSIVNGTDTSGFSRGSYSSTSTSGTTTTQQQQQLPFYFEEYTRGDLCDLDEIAAESGRIVGAGTNRKKQIERATTVKYQCGKTLQMNIKEDSTCHYIVDVDVPELCHHPLFRQPVLKTPFIRCLPE